MQRSIRFFHLSFRIATRVGSLDIEVCHVGLLRDFRVGFKGPHAWRQYLPSALFRLHHGPCARLWSRHLEKSDPDGPLLARLSWATLGQHYRWTERAHEPESRPDTFPPALAQLTTELASAAGEAVRPQAAIVNFYSADSTMGGHLDDAEPCQTAPIVSLSLGLDAIYLIGGRTKAEPPRAVWLGVYAEPGSSALPHLRG